MEAVFPLTGAVRVRDSLKVPEDCGVKAMENVQSCVGVAGQVNGLVTVKFPVVEGEMVTDSSKIPPALPFSTEKFWEALEEPTAWLANDR